MGKYKREQACPTVELEECRRRVRQLEMPSRLLEIKEKAIQFESIVQKHTSELTAATEDLTLETTNRKMAEEARAQLSSLMEHSQEAIIGKTLQGIITSWNSAAQRIFGYTAEEVVGKPITIIFPPDLVSEENYILNKVKEMGFVENYESVRITKDGTLIDVSITVYPMKDLSGNTIGLTSIKRNISGRKKIEAVLASYMTRLEQSNQALQEIVSVASHDLQEPLRKVRLFGERLKDQFYKTLGEEGTEYIDRMQKASQRMQGLIDDLLSYSRVTTKAQPFCLIDLGIVVHEVLADLETRIKETNGQLELGPLPTVEADPNQMRQLFLNLIGNALKYHGPERPLIRVFSRPYLAGFCRIAVEDNGIGFDPKYSNRVFKVFQRLHGRGEYEGTGIGLAICKKIVERHGGAITANSTPGRGSTFIVTLPVRQK